ncbi:MAG: trimeric intracellular cation channel family protein, partial [Planctomycetes bacterium]|nr:trimeric intracellular cation channel family protein [Planctomycetota bacterium]
MQPLLDHVGVFVAAITGVLAARGKRVDLFGVLVLALVTAFGGGTVR